MPRAARWFSECSEPWGAWACQGILPLSGCSTLDRQWRPFLEVN